ncbi:MAG: helix-turn-helix domain-containing protein [Spirochaetales bacterium]|jgi:hypothetical protein|nr:helix-turn-helix domain-containing protein [Spirochaetales bacterium]
MATRTEHTSLFAYEEVAKILCMYPQNLRQWVSSRKFPHLKIAANVRFTRDRIDQYIHSTLVEPTESIISSRLLKLEDYSKEEKYA